MRYTDPNTGKVFEKSTGARTITDAQKAAGKWEAELKEGRYKSTSKVTWAEFRRRYEDQKLASLKDTSERKTCSAFNALERILPILKTGRLSLLTAERLSEFQAGLRSAGLAEETIKGHLASLKAALRWARKMKMLAEVPEIDMPARAKTKKKMKGRAISGEEFDRILAAVPAIVGDQRAASWCHLLNGLFLSGLRLGEAVDLWWDRDDRLCVLENDGELAILVHADLEKGNEDRTLPIAPDFQDFLRRVPETERSGRVFRPIAKDGSDRQMTAHHVGIVITDIGKKAGVKVFTHPRTGKAKFASAHDLRRTFGSRWASRVQAAVLQQLMRHKDFETTLKYYIDHNSKQVSEECRRAIGVGDTLGDSRSLRASDSSPARQKARRK
jgi:integrase